MPKYAFFTMDAETFFDTSCIKRLGVTPYPQGSCAEGIDVFLRLLDKYGIKATMYVTTDSLRFTLPCLKKAASSGHKLALHSTDHVAPTELSLEEFDCRLKAGIETMRQTFGCAPEGYRAPCFKLDDEHEKLVEKYFSYDSSNLGFKEACKDGIFSLAAYEKCNDVVYKKGNFYEFRPCTGKLFGKDLPVSGGGYIRLVPWFVIKHCVKKYIATHDSYMFYVHPFELCDKREACVKKLKFIDRLYVNIGRRNYYKRIEKIINFLKKQGYIFTTPEEYIKINEGGQVNE